MDPQQGTPQADVIVGQTIGNYLVTQKLGEGGMGSVYLAEHPGIGKKVALKVLHSEFSSNEDVTARFFNEAKAVNNIGHPNIVDIIDYGIIESGHGNDQLVYFIMEYLSGITLSELIRSDAPLPPERALGIALQVADALAASHKCGIVHRDLKPDNIMLLQRGRQHDIVKLLDFGIAKLTSNAEGSRRTRTGIVMGTPAYMSPEQCDGRGNIDHRTDIYALGIVIYEMLVGRVPFLGEGYGEVLVQHLTQPPIAPSQFHIIQPHVEMVVLKALEKRVEMRYPNMEEMMRAMSDPVGFVEAHGSLQGFLQYPLTPSNVPVTTSLRIPTPGPITTPHPGAIPTPGAMMPMTGTGPIVSPTGAVVSPTGGVPMPTPYGFANNAAAPTAYAPASNPPIPNPLANPHLTPTPTPVPTTAPGGSKKLPIIVGGVIMVGVLVVAVVLGTRKKGGEAPVTVPPADAAVAIVPPDAAEQVEKPAPDAAEPAGSGSAVEVTVPKVATLKFITKPAGAKILLNGIELNATTPQPFDVPISDKPVVVVLKLRGYKDIVFEKLVPNQDIEQERTFERERIRPVPVNRGSNTTSKGSNTTGKGSNTTGKGSNTTIKRGSNDTGLIKPE